MKVEINYSSYNGKYEGSIIIEGETLKEIGKKVDLEIEKRSWEKENCWSEVIEEEENVNNSN